MNSHCSFCGRDLYQDLEEFPPPRICAVCAKAGSWDATQWLLFIVSLFAAAYGILHFGHAHGWSWPL